MDAPTSDDNFAHGPTSSCLSARNTEAETDPDGFSASRDGFSGEKKLADSPRRAAPNYVVRVPILGFLLLTVLSTVNHDTFDEFLNLTDGPFR